MNPTNPYWEPPVVYKARKHLKPIARDTGFRFQLPWPQPVSAGFYYGENPAWGRKEQVFSAQPEWYAVDNIIPSSGNIPMVNPHTREMKYKRSDYTVKR